MREQAGREQAARGGEWWRPPNLAILYFKEARTEVRVLHFIRAVPCNNLPTSCFPSVKREPELYQLRCSFTMDKSESIMIRTRQKWRRHQQAYRRHLRGTACPPPLLPPSLLFLASCARQHRAKPTLPPPSPSLPRGNRGEARGTFRLITVLQFNEKPVSVLSVHNGRRFDEAGLTRRASIAMRRGYRGVARPQRRGAARANLLTCCWPPLFDGNAAAPFFIIQGLMPECAMGWD